ncbi:CASP-like protein 5B2 [Cardamine amara subsp. amara]|uniref:CASP-like protein n=1 Tax=Cardamine amara subsp. amara TaxID=228776 RepID=A0ABD0ZMK8_CARAN
MKKLFGGPGTVCGLLLRIGQCASAAASIGVMVSAAEFSIHTAFCYLIAAMGLQLLWSFGLACLDVYALRSKKDLQNPILVSLFVVGDWVTAMLSLAASCSSAGVVVLYAKDLKYCQLQGLYPCLRYEVAVVLSFITWVQIAVSSHVTFWILASV